MDGTDARAGQHGKRRLGTSRQVDCDHVALAHAGVDQHVGQTTHFVERLEISNATHVAWLVAFPNDGNLVRTFRQVPIETIVRDVDFSVNEPSHIAVLEAAERWL